MYGFTEMIMEEAEKQFSQEGREDMILTEEQREAIRASVCALEMANRCPRCHKYLKDNFIEHIAVIRVMIDSSGTVGFDLEKARACAVFVEPKEAFLEALDEIERLRAEILTYQGNHCVDCCCARSWKALGIESYTGKSIPEEIEKLQHWVIKNRDIATELQYQLDDEVKETERLRAGAIKGNQFVNELMANCNSLRERVWKAEARIKELELSLGEAEALTKKNAETMNGYLARITELEDALVEGLTNFLHYRASCYDPARRCPYAKECDDCSTWDACGHVEKFRSEARQQLQADGKIRPGDGA